jgi:hypothetical protein
MQSTMIIFKNVENVISVTQFNCGTFFPVLKVAYNI